MKKILTLLGIACAVLACTKTKTDVQSIELTTQRDSVNYALGYLYGFMNNHMIKTDTTGEALKVFMVHFDRLAKGAMKECPTAYKLGYNLGLGVVNFETAGLSNNPKWPLNKDMLLEGFVAGFNQDTTIFTPKKVQKIRAHANTTTNDTLNLAFGWSSGYSFGKHHAADSAFCLNDCMKGINNALRKHPAQPQVVLVAHKVGLLTQDWQEKGLDGKNFPYNHVIFRQALVNGLQKDTTVMNFNKSAVYLNETLPVCLPAVIKRRM